MSIREDNKLRSVFDANILCIALTAGCSRSYLDNEKQEYSGLYDSVTKAGERSGRVQTEWPEWGIYMDSDEYVAINEECRSFGIPGLDERSNSCLVSIYIGGKLRAYLEENQEDKVRLFDIYFNKGFENPHMAFMASSYTLVGEVLK